MYLTQRFVCFRGWPDTSHKKLIPMDAIDHIEKENTAVVIPNAIRVYMINGEEILFGSYIDRDPCYDLLSASIEERNITVSSRQRDKAMPPIWKASLQSCRSCVRVLQWLPLPSLRVIQLVMKLMMMMVVTTRALNIALSLPMVAQAPWSRT